MLLLKVEKEASTSYKGQGNRFSPQAFGTKEALPHLEF